jgi:hypothetical protein
MMENPGLAPGAYFGVAASQLLFAERAISEALTLSEAKKIPTRAKAARVGHPPILETAPL